MSDHNYHKYLLTRSRLSKIYRTYFQYPKINKYTFGKILDLGCGIGDYLSVTKNAIGIDINKDNIDYLQEKGYKAFHMSEEKIPFSDNSFDCVILDNVIEHIENPNNLLKEIERVSTNYSHLLIGVPGIKGFAIDSDHKKFYNLKNLNKLIFKYDYKKIKVMHFPIFLPFISYWFSKYSLFVVYKKNKK